MAKTRDANRILDNVTGDDEELQQMIAEETVNAEVARLIYEARKMAGLTQTELAELIGSKQPVIARLENADYESAPGRTRTCDQRIRNPLLFPLSYRGTLLIMSIVNQRVNGPIPKFFSSI